MCVCYNISEIRKTFDTFANWTAPGAGTYYCTVVAFNGALTPSKEVCSDGVLIDVTHPALSQIAVHNVSVNPGIVRQKESRRRRDVHAGGGRGGVFYVDRHMRRCVLNDSSESCRLDFTASIHVSLLTGRGHGY